MRITCTNRFLEDNSIILSRPPMREETEPVSVRLTPGPEADLWKLLATLATMPAHEQRQILLHIGDATGHPANAKLMSFLSGLCLAGFLELDDALCDEPPPGANDGTPALAKIHLEVTHRCNFA